MIRRNPFLLAGLAGLLAALPLRAQQTAPEFPTLQVKTLAGEDWSLAERRGRWVVVNFWATWCSPCLKEIPDLTAFDAAREDVEVIGLAYEEIEVADMKTFLEAHPAGYAIAIIDVYAPPPDFDTPRGLPMTYLIAPDGRVAKKFLGPVTSRELEQAISAHATVAGTGP
jgi:thiol-disulfide isomerase/thioredoxin